VTCTTVANDHPQHGADEPGSAAYQRYVDAFQVVADEVDGMCLLYGQTECYLIGQGDWDAVLVMHFPSRAAFIQSSTTPSTTRCTATATPACSAKS
jgi:hypothetical protein